MSSSKGSTSGLGDGVAQHVQPDQFVVLLDGAEGAGRAHRRALDPATGDHAVDSCHVDASGADTDAQLAPVECAFASMLLAKPVLDSVGNPVSEHVARLSAGQHPVRDGGAVCSRPVTTRRHSTGASPVAAL